MEIRKNYHAELKELLQEVVHMGNLVIDNLALGMRSLVERDRDLASEVIEKKQIIEKLELTISDRCVVLLVRQAPVATELREIITAMKIVMELKRLGDHAGYLARVSDKMKRSELKIAAPIFTETLDSGCQMLREALQAFLELNSTWAEEIASPQRLYTDKLSELHHRLVDLIKDKPNRADRLVSLLIMNKHLEQIGDRVINICEFVVYSQTSKHVDLRAEE